MQDYEKLGVFYLGREYDPASGKRRRRACCSTTRKDLTTHAVCVGMTGSGKTGPVPRAARRGRIDGIPAICIDPKGDLGNLLLTFPEPRSRRTSRRGSTRPKRTRKGLTVEQFAAQTAETVARRASPSGARTPERIARFRDAVDLAIYTPGSNAGLPLSVLRSFAAPPPELLRRRRSAARAHRAPRVRACSRCSASTPIRCRAASTSCSSNILEHAWRDGHEPRPGGADRARSSSRRSTRSACSTWRRSFPRRSASSSRWRSTTCSPRRASPPGLEGEPLDMQRLLFTPEGKPRIAILSIAHLVRRRAHVLRHAAAQRSDRLDARAVGHVEPARASSTWTRSSATSRRRRIRRRRRRCSRCSSRRARSASACVLATQNPVDLDYKGLANAGTWFLGRLQTERDKAARARRPRRRAGRRRRSTAASWTTCSPA